MSSDRKRRWAAKNYNTKYKEHQITLHREYSEYILRVIHMCMLVPQYDMQKLLTYQQDQRNV